MDLDYDQLRDIRYRFLSCAEELDEMKSSNKAAVHEKLIAVARAKEQMRQEHQSELDRIREQMKNEHKQEVDRLRETIMKQEEELRSLREERLRWTRQQKEQMYNSEKFERTLINEINDECRKTSEMLGLSPRRVQINSNNDIGYKQGTNSTSKLPTTSALAKPDELFLFSHAREVCRANEANLRACNEELRSHVAELQAELESQNKSQSQASRDKEEALSRLRREMEAEKEEEMSRLKEKLVRGLSTNEYRSMMYSPDNDMEARRSPYQSRSPVSGGSPGLVERHQATERHMRAMSEQQQHELERLEREINKLAMNSDQGQAPQSADDVNYAKHLAQLQTKVKQLQTENNSLRRLKLGVASSTPDLSSTNLYNGVNHRKVAFHFRTPSPTREQQRLASNLELRLREHDYETEALTEHQRHNRDVMSKKMAEMTKLQNTLTNQAKELIQLEKSYTQLNQYAKSARPMSSLR